MKILLNNPRKELNLQGPFSVAYLMKTLEINRESFLVIRNGQLIPQDGILQDEDNVEIRPVISGGYL